MVSTTPGITLDGEKTTTAFEFTVVGRVECEEGVPHLVCDGTALRVLPTLKDYPDSLSLWHLVPSTDSTAVITNVRILSSSPLEHGQYDVSRCVLQGRVLQVSKRQQVVLFQVELPEGRALKITLSNPDPRMQPEQLWTVESSLVGGMLHIGQATPRDPIAQPKPVETTETQKLVLATPAPPTELAANAIALETGTTGWELSQATSRAWGWEWEAVNPGLGRRARIQVDGRGKETRLYHYPHSQFPDDTELSAVNDHLVVTPLGAAQGIGASCFRVDIGPYEVVLDCGTRPKGCDPLPALDYLKNPDLLLISHAHQDHIGAVPVFHSRHPGVRMICTEGTREIAHVMLQDCLKVQQANEDASPLFEEADLERTLFRLETEAIGKDFEPLPGLKVRFINAGHIVGAACIYIRYGARSLLYTGDYNTASSRTTEGLKLADLPQADMLITESTYGADSHPVRKTQEIALLTAIAEVVQAGGNVLLPAFALGRAQEILLAIRTSELFRKLPAPIYVDGLVRAVTDTFREHLDLLPDSVQNLVKNNGIEPFYDEKFKPTIIPIGHPRERPLAIASPSVIVASSGMLNGGPSLYYAKTLLERENAAIFISGYTDEESPGRLLQNLQTGDTIELDGKQLIVRAQIRRFNLSAHADKLGLMQVIGKVNPRHLILIHGCRNALHALARSGDLRSKHFIHIPGVGEKIEYGVVPDNLDETQRARIEAPQEFEIEVSDESEGAWIRIPESVVESDPRWRMLARDGVIKAKWEGIGLKLLPSTEQNLVIEKAQASGQDCCARCQHFNRKTSQCGCCDSPLWGLMVDPSGYCLEYSLA